MYSLLSDCDVGLGTVQNTHIRLTRQSAVEYKSTLNSIQFINSNTKVSQTQLFQ